MPSVTTPSQRLKRARLRGNVQVRRQNTNEPRLPHERDESADSANTQTPENQATGRQAAADIKNGMVDTDIGPPLQIAGRRLDGTPEGSPALDESKVRQPLPQDPSKTGKS